MKSLAESIMRLSSNCRQPLLGDSTKSTTKWLRVLLDIRGEIGALFADSPNDREKPGSSH